MIRSFRVLPVLVAAWVLGGPAIAVADVIAGPLPAAPVPLEWRTLVPPSGASAWPGSGAVLPDGTCAIGDLARNRVIIQRPDGASLQTLTDPTANAGQDRGFGAAVALVGTDELLVFARTGQGPSQSPAVHSFRRSAPKAVWQHAGTLRLGGSAAIASAARNPTRIAVAPGERRYAVMWEASTGLVWSVCEDYPGFGWFEQPLGNILPTINPVDYALALRGNTAAALLTSATTFQVRFAAFDVAQQSWFAPWNNLGTAFLGGATGVAINSDGDVLVPSRRADDRGCNVSQFGLVAAPATFDFVAIRALDRPATVAGDAVGIGIGTADDSLFLLSSSRSTGALIVDELSDSVIASPALRRVFRAPWPESSPVPGRWLLGAANGALVVQSAPATVLPAPSGALLRLPGFDDLDGNGLPDRSQIEGGASPDCNMNGVPDAADLALGIVPDTGGNGVPDSCERDCDADGVSDYAAIVAGAADCNRNGIPDASCDANDPALDLDGNGVLDACSGDCDGSGVPDDIELFNGLLADCDGNGVPDGCQGYPAPDIAAGGTTVSTVVRWQPVSSASPVINALSFRSTLGFAVARRLMIVRDRSGVGDRSRVQPEDVLHFVRLPSIVCPAGPDGERLPVTIPLPQFDLSGVPAFWVAIESVTLGAAGTMAPGPGEPGHYVRTGFPEAVLDPAAWVRTANWSPALVGMTPTFSVLGVPCVVPGDFDRDGRVAGPDLGQLVGAWGTDDPLFDLDRNGIVAGGDLSILLGSWSDQ